jgi:hypothetical protein
MKNYIYVCSAAFVFLTGCASSDFERIKCANGDTVLVLKHIDSAYPVYAKTYDQTFNITIAAIDKAITNGTLGAGRKTEVTKLRQDLDQQRAGLQEQLKSAVIQLQTAPCDPVNRKQMADLMGKINDGQLELARIAAGIEKGSWPTGGSTAAATTTPPQTAPPTYATLDNVLDEIPKSQRHSFGDDVWRKSWENLPADGVEGVTTLFFEPKSANDATPKETGKSSFLKIQQYQFQPGHSGKFLIRGRVAPSGNMAQPESQPLLYTYQCSSDGTVRNHKSYSDAQGAYEFFINPGDTVTFIATYNGHLVDGDYEGSLRDWHTVEVSDIAGTNGINYRFYTGAATYRVRLADTYDFFPVQQGDHNDIAFVHRESKMGDVSNAQSFLMNQLSTVLKAAKTDLERDPRFVGTVPFLLADGFAKVDWAGDEVQNQKHDTAYITERLPAK